MKLGGFQVSLSNLLGVHSFVKWKPVSAEGLSEREQIRFFVLSTGWETGQCSNRAGVLGLSPRPLVTSRAGELSLEGSMGQQPLPEEVNIPLHYPPAAQCLRPDRLVCPHQSFKSMRRTVPSNFSLLSSLSQHVESCPPACPAGTTPSNDQSAPQPRSLIGSPFSF